MRWNLEDILKSIETDSRHVKGFIDKTQTKLTAFSEHLSQTSKYIRDIANTKGKTEREIELPEKDIDWILEEYEKLYMINDALTDYEDNYQYRFDRITIDKITRKRKRRKKAELYTKIHKLQKSFDEKKSALENFIQNAYRREFNKVIKGAPKYQEYLEWIRYNRINADITDKLKKIQNRRDNIDNFKIEYRVHGRKKIATRRKILYLAYSPDKKLREEAYLGIRNEYYNKRGEKIFRDFKKILRLTKNAHKKNGFKSYYGQIMHENGLNIRILRYVAPTVYDSRDVFYSYFDYKASRMELKGKLPIYDILAPLSAREIPTAEKIMEEVKSMFREYDTEFYNLVLELCKGHIDNSGSRAVNVSFPFNVRVNPKTLPYVSLGRTKTTEDYYLAAHEIKHAIHGIFQSGRSCLDYESCNFVEEAFAAFSELLMFDHLYKKAEKIGNKEEKHKEKEEVLNEIVGKMYDNIMLPAIYTRFEKNIHQKNKERALGEQREVENTYMEAIGHYLGPSGEHLIIPEVEKYNWLTTPYFTDPFYYEAYTQGYMLALAMYGKYHEDQINFKVNMKNAMRFDGTPEETFKLMGIDITDQNTYKNAMDQVDEWVIKLKTGRY
jgi:oligoendopeptidase F